MWNQTFKLSFGQKCMKIELDFTKNIYKKIKIVLIGSNTLSSTIYTVY